MMDSSHVGMSPIITCGKLRK